MGGNGCLDPVSILDQDIPVSASSVLSKKYSVLAERIDNFIHTRDWIRVTFNDGNEFAKVDPRLESPVHHGDEHYKSHPFGLWLFSSVFGELLMYSGHLELLGS